MNIKRVGKDSVDIEYRHNGYHIHRIIGLSELTEFLTGSALQESNLGPKGIITLDAFCAEWYLPKSARHRLKERTYTREVALVHALQNYFKEARLHDVSRDNWETYQNLRLSGKLSASGKPCAEGTVKKEFKCLRMILSYATALGFLKTNVLAGVKPNLSDGNRSDIWLTKDEITQFLGNLPDGLKRFRDLFEFRIWTGARPEEAALFGKNNVNWETGEIWLHTIKKHRKDTNPNTRRYFKIKSLGPRFEALLKSLVPHPVSGLYFCNPKDGNPYVARYVLKVFDRAISATGITKRLPVVPYDLRGTFAMHRAMVIKSFRQLQTEMGHSSPKSIEHYLDAANHTMPKDSIFYDVREADFAANSMP
jgi:integrase